MRSCIRLCTVAVFGGLVLSACATTKTLHRADCATADWQSVGLADGQQGASSQKILTHAKTCSTLATPNRILWEQGRQEGLLTYCTKTNAYDLGRRGYTLSGVCEHNLEELHKANLMGLEQYELGERLNYYQRGFYDPWFAPYWWW